MKLAYDMHELRENAGQINDISNEMHHLVSRLHTLMQRSTDICNTRESYALAEACLKQSRECLTLIDRMQDCAIYWQEAAAAFEDLCSDSLHL